MSQTFGLSRNSITSIWSVEGLWEVTRDHPAVDWEIPSDFTSAWSWGEDHPADHVERCLNADTSYPILLWEGRVVDGCHRVLLALAQGRRHIKARVISSMPAPDEMIVSNEEIDDEFIAPWTFADVVREVRALI